MKDLESVIERMANADGVKAMIETHQHARGIIKRARASSHAAVGQLAACFKQAMVIWDAQKAEGVSQRDRIRGLRETLKAAWPQTREWKYLCTQCDDYGLALSTCPGDTTCGRHRPHLPHEFGRPCVCGKGRAFIEKPKPSDDDFTQAAKSKPTRVGR